MSETRFNRAAEVFARVCDAAPEEQESLLGELCAGDAELRAHVGRLLDQDQRAAPLDEPALPASALSDLAALGQEHESAHARPSLRDGQRIGRFTILGVLGEGGMGTVYLAEQAEPRRRVALKTITPGRATTNTAKRLRREAQLLASVQHPGIAQVYEVGSVTAEGADDSPEPYIAMELAADAVSITAFARARDLDTRARLSLFADSCDAVAAAHRLGIVHRDLKPANILVSPDESVKVVDFGVARALDASNPGTLLTEPGLIVGTLAYMSPEQAQPTQGPVDTRADVYALGAVLFELLTGRPPLAVDSMPVAVAISTIVAEEPERLSRVSRTFRGDLETIVERCLEKDPARRYADAGALLEDLRRFMGDRPIVARRASAMYRARKFSRRHRTLVVSTCLTFVLLVASLVFIGWLALVADRERRVAESEAAVAVGINDYFNDLLSAAHPARSQGRNPTVTDLLLEAAPTIDDRFADMPAVRARLHRTTGQALLGLGAYGEARTHLERASSLYAELNGDQSVECLGARVDLADAMRNLGDREAALELARQTHASCVEAHGGSSLIAATTGVSYGMALQDSGQLKDAGEVLRRAVETRTELLGESDRQTLFAQGSLAYITLARGELEEAERLYSGVLDAGRVTLGDDHPSTLTAMGALGNVRAQRGDFRGAEPLVRESMERARRVYGPEHPETLSAINNMAAIARRLGETAEAMALYEECYHARERVLGADHPETISVRANLAHVLGVEGRFTESEAHLRACLESLERRGDATPAELSRIANALTLSLRTQGKLDEALGFADRALQLSQESFEAGHPRIAIARANRGLALAGLDRREEAEACFGLAYSECAEALGAQHPQSRTIARLMADMLERWGRAEDVQVWRDRAQAPAPDPQDEPRPTKP